MNGFDYLGNAPNLEKSFKGANERHLWCKNREIELIIKRKEIGTLKEQLNKYWCKNDAPEAIIPGNLFVDPSEFYDIPKELAKNEWEMISAWSELYCIGK